MKKQRCVVLFDVDNTLLNNDQVVLDLRRHLRASLGKESEQRYFEIFEQLRAELGYTDYLGTLQQYRLEHPGDPDILRMSSYLINYPFPKRLYPRALETVRFSRRWGMPVVLSDGDAVFQPRKIERSGLWNAFLDQVMICVHKELMLEDVERLFPADHYIMVDDKRRILDAMKRTWKNRLTTVFVRQGHYALDDRANAAYAAADVSIERISDLMRFKF